MLQCKHTMESASDTDGHRTDVPVHETWWKPYVWQHPGELMQAGQRDETCKDRNGCEWRSALTHWPWCVRPVWAQACQVVGKMAPHWTGVNYGAKGFAKTICHDESSGRQRTQVFFFFLGNVRSPTKREEDEKLSSSLSLSYGMW